MILKPFGLQLTIFLLFLYDKNGKKIVCVRASFIILVYNQVMHYAMQVTCKCLCG